MIKSGDKHSIWYGSISIAVLVIVLVVLFIFLVRQYRIILRREAISSQRIHFGDILHHRSLDASDADLISSWMTFGYIGVSFKVPVSYLTDKLDIASTTQGYPNITIGRYAKQNATSSDTIVTEVRNAVKDYLSSGGK
ncbi:hypothetical protein KGQ27_03550 [Patescibacteria group bacterium]|nr:hypothetical protein [Patescibacteria group bacterium]MDE1946956.1 hypothetical protein [Patescibacteria group bacterium]MDE2011229.1 hypothetical protein [Patescibacteria group bacterium]MDE2233393.1 hypothetical protein [Patescibacteria group bacterium]